MFQKLLNRLIRMALIKRITIVYRKVVLNYLNIRLQNMGALYLIMLRKKHLLASKHFNQGQKAFINRRRTNPVNHKYIVFGLVQKLPKELRDCLVSAGERNTKRALKYFDDTLFRQCESQRMKGGLALAINCTAEKN